MSSPRRTSWRRLAPLLADGPAREEAMAGLREVRERLGRQESQKGEQEGAIERAARICVELLAGGAAFIIQCNGIIRHAGVSNARREPEGSAEPASTYQA